MSASNSSSVMLSEEPREQSRLVVETSRGCLSHREVSGSSFETTKARDPDLHKANARWGSRFVSWSASMASNRMTLQIWHRENSPHRHRYHRRSRDVSTPSRTCMRLFAQHDRVRQFGLCSVRRGWRNWVRFEFEVHNFQS